MFAIQGTTVSAKAKLSDEVLNDMYQISDGSVLVVGSKRYQHRD